MGRDLERWWTAVSGRDVWWSAVIRSLSKVTFHHGYKFFSSKKLIWVCSGLRFDCVNDVMLDGWNCLGLRRMSG